MIVNNSNNVSKTDNHLSSQIVEQREDHDIKRWKIGPGFGKQEQNVGITGL